jgi:adenylylsulfate kinase-like enzyme
MLTEQGLDVVCATMSLFREVHELNRATIQNYYEIFVECDMQELIRRDQKGIYSKALRGECDDVIGVYAPV